MRRCATLDRDRDRSPLPHRSVLLERRSTDDPPETVLILDDARAGQLVLRKLNDAASFEHGFGRRFVGMQFMQNSKNSRIDGFLQYFFLLGAQGDCVERLFNPRGNRFRGDFLWNRRRRDNRLVNRFSRISMSPKQFHLARENCRGS